VRKTDRRAQNKVQVDIFANNKAVEDVFVDTYKRNIKEERKNLFITRNKRERKKVKKDKVCLPSS
jgi:hypothetical protein